MKIIPHYVKLSFNYNENETTTMTLMVLISSPSKYVTTVTVTHVILSNILRLMESMLPFVFPLHIRYVQYIFKYHNNTIHEMVEDITLVR